MQQSNKNKAKKRHEILLYGQEHGASVTCRKYNISRTLYYRWVKQFELYGFEGLKDKVREYFPPNKSNLETERMVLKAIESFPEYGPQSIAWLIEEEGIKLSGSGVYNIMCRHGLNHKQARKIFSKNNKSDGKILDQSRFNQVIPNYVTLELGDLWIVWTIKLGYQKNIGMIYQYIIMEIKSGLTCSRLYSKKNSECGLDLLLGVAIPMANELLLHPKWIMTQNQQEYTSGNVYSQHLYSKNLRDLKIKQLIWEEKKDDYAKRTQLFTQKSFEYLEKIFLISTSLEEIKAQFQGFVREYNKEMRINNGEEGVQSPIERVMQEKRGELTLPLWSYINRSY